ncbi:MAG: hypothetical protein Kow00109_16130 [Acidobacteriota bacterium]
MKRCYRVPLFRLIAVTAWFLPAACSSPPPKPRPDVLWELRFAVEDEVLEDAFVLAELPEALSRPVAVIETTGGRFTPVPSQAESGDSRLLWFLADGETAAGTSRDFVVVPADQAPAVPFRNIELVDDEKGGLLARWGKRHIFMYNYGLRLPEGVDPLQRRNAYLHPVWSPSGRIVTDDFHPDHLHQRGIWFAWTETRFRDHAPDFWNLHKGTGTVTFEGFESRHTGPLWAEFAVRHRHLDLQAKPDPETVIAETWIVRVYRPTSNRPHVIDLTSVQRVVADAPLELQKYHYGGLGVRGSREWNTGPVRFLTSNGQGRPEGDQTRVQWCAIEGPIGVGYAGLLALSHPENFRAPEAVRIHPEMPYFSLTPLPLGPFQMEPGRDWIWRYRFVVYDGSLQQGVAQQFWEEYARPWQAEVRRPQ